MNLSSILLALGLTGATVAPLEAIEPVSAESSPVDSIGEFDHEHAQWTKILAQYVHGDRFDYGGLKKDPQALNDYIATLEAVTPAELASWTEHQQMAFWINVYNAHVIKLIVKEYPVKSIRDLGTLLNKVWDKRFIRLDTHHPSGKPKKLSLDDVEHKILRPKFKDARVHAAVNCASESCPPLLNEAFTGKNLDRQLDGAVRAWIADTTRNRFDRSKNKMKISEIFKWFKGDFERDGGSVREWIAKYAPAETAKWLRESKVKVGYLNYSWKLNDFRK